MVILMWVGIFVVALAFLLWSSDRFIDAAESIGLAMGMSPLIIGSLILAFGTSLPELFTSALSIYAESPDGVSDPSQLVLGNVIGSNIANILLVFGVMAIIGRTITVRLENIWVELIVIALSTIGLAIFVWNMEINMLETIILLIGYLGYIIYSMFFAAKPGGDDESDDAKKDAGWKKWLVLTLGGVGIYVGANYTVESIIRLSQLLDFGVDAISLTAVALGTSLPELVVSVVSIRKGKGDMAVGNVIGSNIFNILGVVSIPSLLSLLTLDRGLGVTDDIFKLSVPVMGLATLLLLLVLLTRKVRLWHGVILLALYMLFYVELFGKYLLG